MSIQVQAAVRDAFVRFRDAHDVDALAFVFDHVAQGLLLVAGHLAGPGVDAEDLVQATFVHAMRNARAYDDARPLEPWLLGILGNEARNARRRARRAIDGTRLPPTCVDDPGIRAEQRERVQQLQEAIDALPERQREVMALHWVYGMSPTEIAHVLGRPVGSVKSWVHRSLVQLRRKVPAVLAVAPRLALPEGTRLGVVRDAVLAAARNAVGTAAGTVAVPALVPVVAARGMTRLRSVLAAMAAAAVPLAAWLLLAGNDSDPGSPATAAVAAADPDAARNGGDPSPAVAGAGSTRTTAPPAAGDSELVVVAHWHDGAPAAVRGDVEPRYASDVQLRRVEFATDALGRARVTGLAPGAVCVRLDRGSERLLVLQPGANVAELGIARGLSVRGRVLDDRGEPVGGADVRLMRDACRDDGTCVARTGTDGAFAVRDVPAGAAIAAFADGFVPTRAITVPERGDGEDVPVDLCFEQAAGEATVVVTGPDGAPLGAVWVQVGGCDPSFADGGPLAAVADDCRPPPPWLGRTGDDGRVLCRQVPQRQRVPVFARSCDHAGACAWLRVVDEPAALTLRLPPAATFAGTARHAAAPAADAAVRVVADAPPASPARLAPRWFVPQVRAAGDGSWLLTGVAFGATAVEARDGVWFAVTERHVGAAGVSPWHATLTRGGRVAGVARCADGTPLDGWRIELHARGATHGAELAGGGAFAIEHLGEQVFEAVLREPLALGDGVLLRRPGVRVGDALDLVVAAAAVPTASVRGRLLDAAGEPLPCGALDTTAGPFAGREFACEADGSFVVERLPPGDYVLLGGASPYKLLMPFPLGLGEARDVGTLRAAPLAHCVVAIASDRARAGLEVNLRFRANARTMVNVARWLGPFDEAWMAAPAGEYVLGAFDGGVDVHQQRVVLAAGTTTKVQLPPPARAPGCVIELRFPTGSSWTWVRWRLAGDGWERGSCTGPRPLGRSGSVHLALTVPAGSCRFTAVADTGERADSAVAVTESPATEPIVVELR